MGKANNNAQVRFVSKKEHPILLWKKKKKKKMEEIRCERFMVEQLHHPVPEQTFVSVIEEI